MNVWQFSVTNKFCAFLGFFLLENTAMCQCMYEWLNWEHLSIWSLCLTPISLHYIIVDNVALWPVGCVCGTAGLALAILLIPNKMWRRGTILEFKVRPPTHKTTPEHRKSDHLDWSPLIKWNKNESETQQNNIWPLIL